MRKESILLLLFSLLVLVDGLAQSNIKFDALKYRYVGPTRGGRVTTVAGVASQPHVFYMGSTGGGVWKTTDYGTRWTNISDAYFASPSIGAIRVALNDPNIIYVGTGSDGLRSNVISGKGMYKSVDAGKSWQAIGLEKTGQIGAVEIHPQNNNIVFVAAIGQAFGSNKERGVFRTKDGGQNWEKVLYLSDTTGFADLEFMPSNPDIIYATAWRGERKPWTIISGGKENGIYKSIDGGDTWTKIGQDLPPLMGKIDLAVSPSNSSVVYALIEAPGERGGVYRSDNQGQSFTHVSGKKNLRTRPFYYTNIEADPQNADVVYVMATRYLKSTDGGRTWKYRSAPHGDHHDMWINPHDSNLFIQANDGGANVTHNGGETWSTQFNQPTAELYQVEVDNQHPYWLYAGQQDNYSTVSVPSLPPRSHQAGGVGYIMDTGGCETGPAVPNPQNPNIVYSNCKGRFSVFNKVTGQEQRYDVGARNMYGHNPKDLKFRFQRVSPIHVSPHDAKVIYHTSQYVHRTTDEGKNWEIISPDLTAFEKDKQVISGAPITRDITGEEFYSTIYSIQESKIQKGMIWVGANDGPVHLTRDGGQNWAKVTPEGLADGGRVDCVEPSPHDAAKAYISVLRYQLNDWKPYIYRTNNYGKSWTLLSNGKNGIPADYPVRVVREDPDRAGLLYAGTEFGCFVSFDDGKNWQAFQQNLPVTPITDIKVHRKDLVLSTMGRGFWILDNLGSLHQKIDVLENTSAQLFRPADTYRYRYPNFSRGAFMASPKYPGPSVIIDYYIPALTDSVLQLQIINEAGQMVSHYSNKGISNAAKAMRDMATGVIDYTVNTRLKARPGLNRFRWNMRHQGPWDKSPKRRFQNGPYVSPGQYTVRLIIAGQSYEQTFELLMDPKATASGISMDDLKAQEALSLQVVDLISEAKKKANEVEKAIKAKKADPQQLKTLEALKSKLLTTQGNYEQPQYIDQLNYLYGILRRGDQLPGRDVYQRFEELKQQYQDMVD
ncbi:MAG: hypothetical protein AAGG75_04745 [Bacteroidota bacterium]